MVILTEPSERYLKSYMEACDEYKANGVSDYAFTDARSCDIFEKFDNYRYARNLKPNRVGSDYYWLVDDEKDYFIGEITIRHRLTEELLLRGGHIGYGVRCGEWNRGYGTQMLRLALEKAKQRGLTKVLITCDDANSASAKVMENNGFVLSDRVEGTSGHPKTITRRYWKSLQTGKHAKYSCVKKSTVLE